MSITIPPEITWLFPIVVGESWPEGDEDKLRALGDAWRAGGVDVGEVITQAKTAADQAMAGMDGPAAEAFEQYWNTFVAGSEAYLTQLQEACEGLGDSCDNCALEVEYAKYSIIAALIMLAIEIAALVAAAFGTFGASTAGIPVAQAATRITVQMIFRQLITAILREVLIEVGIDAAIQGIQMAKGDRTSWDWSKTGNAALSGAISGAIGGGMDFVPTRATGLGGNVVEGAARGSVEGVASTVATAAVTGQDITAGDLLRAGVSGGVSGGVGGAKTHFDTPTVNTPGSPPTPGSPGSPDGPPAGPGPSSPPPGPSSPGSSSPGSSSPGPSSPGPSSPGSPDGPSGSPTPPAPGTRTPDGTTSASGLTPPPDGPSSSPGSSAPPRLPVPGPGDGPSQQNSPSAFGGQQQGGAPSQAPAGGAPRPGGFPGGSPGGGAPGGPSSGGPGSGGPGSGNSTPGSSNTGGPSSGGSTPGGPNTGGQQAGGPNAGTPNTGGPQAGTPNTGAPNTGGPQAGSPNAGTPNTGGPQAGGSTPGGPTPGSSTPGGPAQGGPSAGGPSAGGPTPGGPAPGGPAPSGPAPSGPGAGGHVPGSSGAGGPSAGGPAHGGPTPGAPAAGGPTSGGGFPAGGGPGNFGPNSGFNSPGDGQSGNGQGGAGPMGGAPMGGAPGSGGPGGSGGRHGDGNSYPTTGASTASPSAFADTGTFGDPRGGGPSDRMPEQRGVPQQQPNQGFGGPPPAAGFGGPQPGGGPAPQPGGPSPRPEFGPGARPPFGPGADQGFGPRPDSGAPRPNPGPGTDALNRPPQQPHPGPQPGGPGTGPQPGGPAPRPDATARPDGTTTRPDPGTRPDGTRPDTGIPARPDATARPDGSRPDGSTPARPDATTRPDGARPDGSPEPSRSPEPDVSRSAEPDVSRSPGEPPTPDNQPINGEDSDGPTPDDDGPAADTGAEVTGTDAPPVSGEPDDGPPVDGEGVPLNYLGNRQGEHPFADMGEYVPMGGDRSNGMGSYDQRVAPLISDHNPWGVHGSRDEFNAAHRPDGTFRTNRWPDNDGAVPGSERQVTLPPGTVLDRFGAESGRFLSPLDTDGQPYHYRDRAIFPDNAEVGYHVYVVDDPNGLPGTLADVAPALGQPGGGRQFTLPEDVSLQRLIADGTVREVHVPPADGRVLPDSFGRDNGDGTQDTGTVSVDDAHNGTDPAPDTGTGAPGSGTTPLPDHLRQVADDSSLRTPAGGALFDAADVRTRDAANAVRPIDGHFVLDVHSDGQHAIVGDQRLTGTDLADLARDMGWNGTDPIILNGCEAGRHPDGLAADLARASGAPVIAPTERSWSGEQNRTPYSSSVDSVDDRGRVRPTIPPDGGWRSFDPDGTVRDTGSDGLPVDHRAPGDSIPATPGDGPAPTDGPVPGDGTGQDTDPRLPHGDDVDRGRIQSPWHPPTVTDPGAPHTIRVDDSAAASADPNDAHRPLREGERLTGRDGLTPNSRYEVPGRGTYYTDGTGTITHADLEVSNTQDGMTAAGADRNPDASYPEPNTTYRIDVGGAEHVYTTDDAGLPPRYTEWNPPQPTNGTVTFPSADPALPPTDPRVRPPTPDDPLNARDCWPPNSEIVHVTPNGTTRLYTGDVDPATGTARVEAIDTNSSPGNGARGRVLVGDLNPELNNFPPNTVTRINGQDVYVTNEHGVTFEATDQRTYGHSAPRSGEAQRLVGDLGTNTDGGHIRPTGADGAPDARNQFPQDSDENRPKKGQTIEGTWYGQDREGRFEQGRGTTHEWHDLETEGSHAASPQQPTAVHERWVMRDSNGNIRLHFRRYDN